MITVSKPYIIKGSQHIDDRGILSFINDFDMSSIKRMYTISHPSTSIIRAWQGHKVEKKYFKCVKGSFLVSLIKIDDWKNPSYNLKPVNFILDSKKTEILSIPCGYANGFKALEENSQLVVYSNLNLDDAKDDQYKFDEKLWFDWNH